MGDDDPFAHLEAMMKGTVMPLELEENDDDAPALVMPEDADLEDDEEIDDLLSPRMAEVYSENRRLQLARGTIESENESLKHELDAVKKQLAAQKLKVIGMHVEMEAQTVADGDKSATKLEEMRKELEQYRNADSDVSKAIAEIEFLKAQVASRTRDKRVSMSPASLN